MLEAHRGRGSTPATVVSQSGSRSWLINLPTDAKYSISPYLYLRLCVLGLIDAIFVFMSQQFRDFGSGGCNLNNSLVTHRVFTELRWMEGWVDCRHAGGEPVDARSSPLPTSFEPNHWATWWYHLL